MDDLDRLAVDSFTGRIVRKDLSKKIKGSLNVPIYVLEYLLGMYCATEDEDSIEQGVERVKKILADNYVRPDEAEKIKFKITENGSFTVIDRVGGTINPIEELANVLQVAHDAGANKILLPSNAKKQIVDVPDDLFVTFQIIFYNSPEDAVFKALGIE